MSYIAPPRLSFFGTVKANAATTTNNDLADVFDVDNVKLKPQMTLIPQGKAVAPAGQDTFSWSSPQDNPNLRNWLMGLITTPGVNEDCEGGACFGQQAHWNYYGDHNTTFEQTTISGAVLSNYQSTPGTDPLLKATVELLGDVFYQRRRGAVLVDVDPYALVTSQIFSGQLLVSVMQNGKKVPVLALNDPSPAYAYYINPHKNLNPACKGFEGVSAIFQFSCLNSSIQFFAPAGFNSPALDELKQKAAAGQGLMVRYCFYDAIFNVPATDLHKQFSEGQYVANPYVGNVLGSIGVWGKNELASAPPGRKLQIQLPYSYTPPSNLLTVAQHSAKKKATATLATYKAKRTAPLKADDTQQKAVLGVSLAQVDTANNVVSLDCISTFPESAPKSGTKYFLGTMNLALFYTDNTGAEQSVTVGTIPYLDATLYQNGGGVLDIPYANNANRATINANIATGRLAIQQVGSPTNNNLLLEVPSIDVQTDNRAVYFDARVPTPKSSQPGTSQVTIQVFEKGVAPTMSTTLNLEYWMCQKNLINPDKPQVPVVDRYFMVEGAMPITPTEYPSPFMNGPPGPTYVLTDQITVPPGGRLTLNITALRPGVSMIRFVNPLIQPPPLPNFGWDNVDYTNIRILPFDDFRQFTDQQINNWDFIYANVFSLFSVMYPIMSKVIPWGPDNAPNNPAEVKAFASNILNFTDASNWGSTIYMPITRDLSGGKRELLQRWCNLQQ